MAGEPPLRRLYLRVVFRLRQILDRPAFSHAMLVVIVANTAVLAMEYDGMSTSYAAALVRGRGCGAEKSGRRRAGRTHQRHNAV